MTDFGTETKEPSFPNTKIPARCQRPRWGEALVVGVLVFGLIGTMMFWTLLGALVVFIRSDTKFGSFFQNLALSAVSSVAVAAAFVGVLAWRLVKGNGTRLKRGALAGATTAFLAHPLASFLYGVCGAIILKADWLQAVSHVLTATWFLTFSSVIMVGWISVPLGALLGTATTAVLSSVRRSEMSKSKDDEYLDV